MTRLELRPRLATEIVDAAFQLYRRHFGELVSLSAAAFGPFVVVQLVLLGGAPLDPTSSAGAVAVGLLGWIVGSLLEAAVVVAVSNSYLHGAPNIADALRRTGSRFFQVLFAVAAKWILIGLGVAAAFMVGSFAGAVAMFGARLAGAGGFSGVFVGIIMVLAFVGGVVAGVYFFACFFAVPATVVLERAGVAGALRRSRELSRGHRWRVIGALGIPLLLIQLFRMILGLLLPGPLVIGFAVEQALVIVIMPIASVIATLLYYDVRIRKEGFDIEVMAAELGSAPDAPPATATPQP